MWQLLWVAQRPAAGPAERHDAQTNTADDAGRITGVRFIRPSVELDAELFQCFLNHDICTAQHATLPLHQLYIRAKDFGYETENLSATICM